MKRKLLIICTIALIVALVPLLVLILLPDSTQNQINQNPPDYSQWLAETDGEARDGFATTAEIDRLYGEGRDAEATLEAYRSYARYPHDSRPLTKEMIDLIEPFNVGSVPLPVLSGTPISSEDSLKAYVTKLREAGKDDAEIANHLKGMVKSRPTFHFTTNRVIVTANDVFTATLAIARGDQPVAYSVLSAELLGDLHFGGKRLGSVDYNDLGMDGDAQANDGLTTFAWKPPGADKKYFGDLTIRVRLKVAGLDEEVTIERGFLCSPVAPAKFTGAFQERLENGSLVIDVGMQVYKDCRYKLFGNLFSVNDDEPTHLAQVSKVLAPGQHTISLRFFGKIFRDGGYSGKFLLRDLRGSCENMPFPASWLDDPEKIDAIAEAEPVDEPSLVFIPSTKHTYLTRSYGANEFSDSEWNDPEKDTRLKMLEEAALLDP